MTLHATRTGQVITIHGNTGVDVEVRNSQLHGVHISEIAQHARSFCDQLGKLLDAADEERKAAEHPQHEHPHHDHAERNQTGPHTPL